MDPQAAELRAPDAWRAIDFISDLHLHPTQPATHTAWQAYMAATTVDAVFILGDLFEVWIGDDEAESPGFAADCAAVLRAAAQARPVFFLHGNRDFLVGRRLLDAAGVTLLDDPTVLTYAGQRWLLTHGDALCLDDHRYLAFRDEVRQPAWQQTFLAQPLERRRAIAEGLRGQSEDRKRAEAGTYAEIDHPAALRWLQAADASVLIHGHTHRPGDDALDESHRRHVLSDWDAEASPPRLEGLRITDTGVVRRVAAR